jgi:hypothetical protein
LISNAFEIVLFGANYPSGRALTRRRHLGSDEVPFFLDERIPRLERIGLRDMRSS